MNGYIITRSTWVFSKRPLCIRQRAKNIEKDREMRLKKERDEGREHNIFILFYFIKLFLFLLKVTEYSKDKRL